jgi:hypothetical protein
VRNKSDSDSESGIQGGGRSAKGRVRATARADCQCEVRSAECEGISRNGTAEAATTQDSAESDSESGIKTIIDYLLSIISHKKIPHHYSRGLK